MFLPLLFLVGNVWPVMDRPSGGWATERVSRTIGGGALDIIPTMFTMTRFNTLLFFFLINHCQARTIRAPFWLFGGGWPSVFQHGSLGVQWAGTPRVGTLLSP